MRELSGNAECLSRDLSRTCANPDHHPVVLSRKPRDRVLDINCHIIQSQSMQWFEPASKGPRGVTYYGQKCAFVVPASHLILRSVVHHASGYMLLIRASQVVLLPLDSKGLQARLTNSLFTETCCQVEKTCSPTHHSQAASHAWIWPAVLVGLLGSDSIIGIHLQQRNLHLHIHGITWLSQLQSLPTCTQPRRVLREGFVAQRRQGIYGHGRVLQPRLSFASEGSFSLKWLQQCLHIVF